MWVAFVTLQTTALPYRAFQHVDDLAAINVT